MEKYYKSGNDHFDSKKEVIASDIYHSPFYPLPEHPGYKKYKSSFITCYDLIPVMFPQYFERGMNENMSNILNSLSHETWVLCISESTRTDLLNHLGNKLNPERVIVTPLAASDNFIKVLIPART